MLSLRVSLFATFQLKEAKWLPEEAEDAVGDGTEEEANPKRAIIGGGDAAECNWQDKPKNGENYVRRLSISLFLLAPLIILGLQLLRMPCFPTIQLRPTLAAEAHRGVGNVCMAVGADGHGSAMLLVSQICRKSQSY